MLRLVGVRVVVGVVVEVVDGSHCGANAGTDECTTPGSYRSAGERPTTYLEAGECCLNLLHFLPALLVQGSKRFLGCFLLGTVHTFDVMISIQGLHVFFDFENALYQLLLSGEQPLTIRLQGHRVHVLSPHTDLSLV